MWPPVLHPDEWSLAPHVTRAEAPPRSSQAPCEVGLASGSNLLSGVEEKDCVVELAEWAWWSEVEVAEWAWWSDQVDRDPWVA